MIIEQSDAFYLKLKIQEQENYLHSKDPSQDINQIRIIKQKSIDKLERNQNIQNLLVAISKLYYAMYQIKDKQNLQMVQVGNIALEKQNSFHNVIKTLIKKQQDLIKQLSQNEARKYSDANNWTDKILSQQLEFADFFQQIQETVPEIKRLFFEKHKTHLIILHQNQNENCNKFLFTFCFIQNIKLEQEQEQSRFSSQCQITDDNQNNQNQKDFDHREKKNLYINISSDIKQQDIDFWTIYMKDYKNKNQLLILHPQNQDKNSFKNSKLKNNTRNELIVPIIYLNEIEIHQMKMIYESILDQYIKNLNPDCIYLEYLLSKELKLDLKALEYLIRKLQKRAKLIIHFRISLKEKFSEYELFSNLNAIIMGVSGFKNQEKKFISKAQYENIVNWTFQMISIYENSDRKINLSLQSELQLMQIQILEFNKIFGCLSDQHRFQWIENKNFYSQTYQHFVFKEAIVLYDKISGDIFYYDRKLINSDLSSHLQIKFKKIQLNQELIEPSIIVLQNYLIIVYGHFKDNQFSNQILVYDLQDQCQNHIVMVRDKEYAQFKHSYYENQSSETIVNRIKNRRGPQICNNNLLDKNNKNFMSFILIGGEERESNTIMNIIEVVILNLKNQNFCSFIVNKSQLCKCSSLKPWPYQVVLDGKQDCTCFYLVLNGNQTKKLNYFSFPKNLQFLQQAQLLLQKQNSFQLVILPIKLMQKLIQIDELFDDCKCQYFDEVQSQNNCFVWKLLITRFILFHQSIMNHPLFSMFKNILISLQSNKFLQICFEVKIKLFLQVLDSKSQNYSDSHVEIDYQVLEIQSKNND